MEVVYYYGEELYHHGIQGQKWGVRRYQNPDGTLTDEGKKRYDKIVKRETKAFNRQYGLREKIVNKDYDKYKGQAEFEKNNGGITDKTRIKLKNAEINKKASEHIRKYAEKTIKEIDPSSYKSNLGKRVALLITFGGIGGGIGAAKFQSSTQKDIQRFATLETRRAKEEKEKIN